MKFELKKDKGMMILITIPLILSFVFTLGAMFIDATYQMGFEVAIILISYMSIAYLLYSFYNQSYYALEEERLFIKFGFFKFRIPYSQITQIKEASNWWSSLALSKQRVAIYKNGRLWNYVGPKDRETFIKELNKRVKAFNNIDF